MADLPVDSTGVANTVRSALWTAVGALIGGAFLATLGTALVVGTASEAGLYPQRPHSPDPLFCRGLAVVVVSHAVDGGRGRVRSAHSLARRPTRFRDERICSIADAAVRSYDLRIGGRRRRRTLAGRARRAVPTIGILE